MTAHSRPSGLGFPTTPVVVGAPRPLSTWKRPTWSSFGNSPYQSRASDSLRMGEEAVTERGKQGNPSKQGAFAYLAGVHRPREGSESLCNIIPSPSGKVEGRLYSAKKCQQSSSVRTRRFSATMKPDPGLAPFLHRWSHPYELVLIIWVGKAFPQTLGNPLASWSERLSRVRGVCFAQDDRPFNYSCRARPV